MRTAHTYADLVVTPINDSFVDLDVIADLDGKSGYNGPGVYAEMLLSQRRKRLESWHLGQEWVVVRNRLGQIRDHNKQNLADTLDTLSERMSFRVAVGLSERVIFRQLFLAGLTVLDLTDPRFGVANSPSHRAAVAEVCSLLRVLGLPCLADRTSEIAAGCRA